MTHIVLRHMAQGMHGSNARLTTHFAQHQHISLEQVTADIVQQCTLTRADVLGCLAALTDIIAHYVARGCSVSLGDLGTFGATLTSETIKAKTTTSAVSINTGDATTDTTALCVKEVHIRRITFRANRVLRDKANEALQRSVVKPRHIRPIQRSSSSRAIRLLTVQNYLREHRVISVRQCASLLGISHRMASEDLRYWRERTAQTHIGTAGQGTHCMAVWLGTQTR